jgi:nitrogen fixation NifU-like protein
LTQLLLGKPLSEARHLSAEAISQALGGLPPASYHAAQLAADALRAVLAASPPDLA